METYFNSLPLGINARIISKLFRPGDVDVFQMFILGNVSNLPEFINLWKIIAGKNYYNPNTMSITEHPLILDLHAEFIKLRKNVGLNTDGILIMELDSGKWVHVSEFVIMGKNKFPKMFQKPFVRIDTKTLDVYSGAGKVSRGNLFDFPYHGKDLINEYGVIVNTSKYKKRLEDLKK